MFFHFQSCSDVFSRQDRPPAFPCVLAMYGLGLSNSDDPLQKGIAVLLYYSLFVMVLKCTKDLKGLKDLKDRSVLG